MDNSLIPFAQGTWSRSRTPTLPDFSSLFAPRMPGVALEILVGVVDTDVLLRDIRWTFMFGAATQLMQAAREGQLRLFTTPHVRREVLEKIDELAPRMKWESEYARRIWHQEWEPWIRVLDPSGLPHAAPEVAETYALDVDDGPTAQLATVISADLIFSANIHHFPSLAVVGNQYACVAVACRQTSEYRVVLVGVNGAVMFSLGIGWAAGRAVIDLLPRVDKRIYAGLGIAIGLVLLCPLSRKWIFQHGQNLIVQASERAVGLARPITDYVTTIFANALTATQVLEGTRRVLAPPRRLRDFAAAVLARATGPLTLEQLGTAVAVRGYRARGGGAPRYLESILRAYPQLFRETNDGSWELATTGGLGPAAG